METTLTTGTLAGTGSFRCLACDDVITLNALDPLPPCPSCGGTSYVRASLFVGETLHREVPSGSSEDRHKRAQDIREELPEPGQYLTYEDGERLVLVPLVREWTRIGRSLAADVRFDDPTVSRRHALIVRQHDGVRVLDDRSLNGVFVNGERVEWRALEDGDEILVGRYRLQFIDAEQGPTRGLARFGRRADA